MPDAPKFHFVFVVFCLLICGLVAQNARGDGFLYSGGVFTTINVSGAAFSAASG